MVKKQALMVPGPVSELELVVDSAESVVPNPGLPVAIIAHPHPLHGGTMDNKVVTSLSRMYRLLGIDAVRFNFRGVGGSSGEYDQGRGEVDDVLAVVDYIRQQRAGAELMLAGFSFGSAMVAAASEVLAARSVPCRHLVLVAPPVDRYSYAPEGSFTCSCCLVIGDEDEIVDSTVVRAWVETLNTPPKLINIPGAGHFFHGCLTELRERLEPEVRAFLS